MKISQYFDLRELICEEIYTHPTIGDRSIDFINANAISVLDDLRREFGAITINNWHSGGHRNNSGFRAPDSDTGANYSAHKMGTMLSSIM